MATAPRPHCSSLRRRRRQRSARWYWSLRHSPARLPPPAPRQLLKALGVDPRPVHETMAAVIDGAAARDAAARAAGRSEYRQVAIVDAVAGFAGTEDMLVSTVRAWLAASTDTP